MASRVTTCHICGVSDDSDLSLWGNNADYGWYHLRCSEGHIARLQGIREGLEWAQNIAEAQMQEEDNHLDPEDHPTDGAKACARVLGRLRAGVPEQIAAEADKEGGSDGE